MTFLLLAPVTLRRNYVTVLDCRGLLNMRTQRRVLQLSRLLWRKRVQFLTKPRRFESHFLLLKILPLPSNRIQFFLLRFKTESLLDSPRKGFIIGVRVTVSRLVAQGGESAYAEFPLRLYWIGGDFGEYRGGLVGIIGDCFFPVKELSEWKY